MTRKRILPIPLILLIPVLLLAIVVIAGIYRFSLSDEDIMAKFPQTQPQANSIVAEVLGIQSRNPWTVQVPEQGAVTFLDEWDKEHGLLKGQYDAGATKGEVLVPTEFIAQRDINGTPWIIAPVIVTTQGSGAFYYLGLFKFDAVPSRVVLLNSVFLGDRIKISSLEWVSDMKVSLSYLEHGKEQSLAEQPNQLISATILRVGNSLSMQQ
ncbi:hypothetical protein DA096_02670 [Vibrio rotiferianus]|uniref:hypothetical protein n=1 Tax=Vibrio rotiferianus TaxID=190895 RepID=UPI0011105CA6|nr:hypothetical protein [Vibrio rotiferianus]TMX42917.1 hypothetical protein DA095_04010 [Vibrio rotiferianus]TMX59374.1 hypothetical protein DA093_03090 [Vibrio rotiferianus]TMX68944.1 hypothetical protein DA096_02670 [Vibrio rotiferianus]